MNNKNADIVIEYTDGVMTSSDKIEHRGENPREGLIVAKQDGKSAIAIHNGTYCAYKIYEENEIKLEKTSKDVCLEKIDVVEVVIPGFDSVKGVNKPVLSSGMTPIKWDENNVEIETTENDTNWYNYNETDKKWANARTEDGSYWVWIPRYAYKMNGGYHSSSADSFDIIFLKGKTIENNSGKIIETSGYDADTKNTSDHYFLHPAFTFGSDETLGFWVAKYEASNTAAHPKFVPNVPSLRSMTINDQFNAAYNMKNNNVYGWISNKVAPHMMTNLEWGAIAYLTHSKYGANQEVWINNNSNYTTGCAGNSVSDSSTSSCNAYNTENGQKASTTHNITGIYDMSGGVYEYVSAHVNNGHANLITNGSNVVNAASEYKGVYMVSVDSAVNNYTNNKNIYGDAVWETSSSSSGATSWNGDYSSMPNSLNPFFLRGGYCNSTSNAGVFYFYSGSGISFSYYSFRVAVIIP